MESIKKEIDNVKRNPIKDYSLWSLMLSNFVTLYLAVKQDWSVLPMVWVYTVQVFIIGIVNFIRIVQLEKISDEERIVIRKVSSKGEISYLKWPLIYNLNKDIVDIIQGFLFLLVWVLYCFILLITIHGVYVGESWKEIGLSDLRYIVLASLIFFINHLFSYFYNRKYEEKRYTFMFLLQYPMIRTIMPMMLVIAFGSYSNGSIFYFFVIKTISDLFMHFIIHEYLNQEKIEEQDLEHYT